MTVKIHRVINSFTRPNSGELLRLLEQSYFLLIIEKVMDEDTQNPTPDQSETPEEPTPAEEEPQL